MSDAFEPVHSLTQPSQPPERLSGGSLESEDEDILGSVPAMASKVDPLYFDAIVRHVNRTIGVTNTTIFHEIVSPHIHIDVLMVPPGWRRPWTTLITCGAGYRKMNTPTEETRTRLELAICLPNTWPDLLPEPDSEKFIGPGGWIVSNLQYYGRFPFLYNTWLGEHHTILHGEPPQALTENSELCCAMLAKPRRISNPDFQQLALPNGDIVHFWSVLFLTEAEMKYKLKKGAKALQEKLRAAKVDELLHLERPGVYRPGILDLF